MEKFIGLMSGTSMDAIDAVLVEFESNQPRLLAHHHHRLTDELRRTILSLQQSSDNEIACMARLDGELGHLFAEASLDLLRQAGCKADAISAIGSHGQTIRHYPESPFPTSIQLGDANVIAEQTGITTVADFRRRDMAAGGQGAPLVPAFHQHVFRHKQRHRVIVNIGGIANITILAADSAIPVVGFDTGPGNSLMDVWIERHQGQRYDQNGQWAAKGKLIPVLLEKMLADPYFALTPPKSTGREYFHLDWLETYLDHSYTEIDIQATLSALTVHSICQAIEQHASHTEEVLVCGGGVHNQHLMTQLRLQMAPRHVTSTLEAGVDPDWVEAICFAWLARQTLNHIPGNLPSVTGAAHPVILGGIYYGK